MENLRLCSLWRKFITRVGLEIKKNTDTPFPINSTYLVQDVSLTFLIQSPCLLLAIMPSHYEGLLTTVTIIINMFYFLFIVSDNGALSHQGEVTNTEACNACDSAFFISCFVCHFFIILSEKQ